jgi:hypothetical protein
MCIFVVLCVDEAYYFMCEYSAAIKLPKSYSPPPHQKKELKLFSYLKLHVHVT